MPQDCLIGPDERTEESLALCVDMVRSGLGLRRGSGTSQSCHFWARGQVFEGVKTASFVDLSSPSTMDFSSKTDRCV